MSTTAPTKEELRKKFLAKLSLKRVARMSKVQRKTKVDDLCTKMGVSDSDMKTLSELSNTIQKQNKNKSFL